MLFWITWIIGNLVYVKIYHTQNSFQVFDHDYTRLSFLTPIDIQGHIPKSQIFHCPKSVQFDSYFFPLIGATWTILGQKCQDNPNLTKAFSFDRNFPSLGQPEPFRAQKTRQVQTWLKLCPLTGTSHKPSLIQKNLSRQFTLLQHIKSASLTIRVPKQKKEIKKWKKNYDLSIMHLGYLNESKQEKSPSNKWEIWNSRKKKKIWSD